MNPTILTEVYTVRPPTAGESRTEATNKPGPRAQNNTERKPIRLHSAVRIGNTKEES